MLDLVPGTASSRNQSLHSISPSLDGTESLITKQALLKSSSIKGSGLKLLTDQDTLNQYLDPQSKAPVAARQKSQSHSHSHTQSHTHLRGHSISSSRSMRKSSERPMTAYAQYSAFNGRSNGRSNGKRRARGHRSRQDNVSVSSVNSALSTLSGADPELREQYTELTQKMESFDHKDAAEQDQAQAIPIFSPIISEEHSAEPQELSTDILNFFAM